MKYLGVFAALALTLAASPLAVAQSARLPHAPPAPPAIAPVPAPPSPIASPPPPLSRRARMCRDEADEQGMRGAQREMFLRRCQHG